MKVGGRTLTSKGGSCDRSAPGVAVNIGAVKLGLSAARPGCFGLHVGHVLDSGQPASKGGSYKGSAPGLDAR